MVWVQEVLTPDTDFTELSLLLQQNCLHPQIQPFSSILFSQLAPSSSLHKRSPSHQQLSPRSTFLLVSLASMLSTPPKSVDHRTTKAAAFLFNGKLMLLSCLWFPSGFLLEINSIQTSTVIYNIPSGLPHLTLYQPTSIILSFSPTESQPQWPPLGPWDTPGLFVPQA